MLPRGGAAPQGADLLRCTTRHFSLLNTRLTIVNATDPGGTRNMIGRYPLEHVDRRDLRSTAPAPQTISAAVRRFARLC